MRAPEVELRAGGVKGRTKSGHILDFPAEVTPSLLASPWPPRAARRFAKPALLSLVVWT